MDNQFSVTPLGGLDVGSKLTQIIEGGKQQYRIKQMQEKAPEVFESEDPAKIAKFMLEYPEMAPQMQTAIGAQDALQMKEASDVAKSMLAPGADPKEILAQYALKLKNTNRDPSKPTAALAKVIEDPTQADAIAKKLWAISDPQSFVEYQKTFEQRQDLAKQTDIDDFVADASAEAVRTTGQPLTPGQRNEMRLKFKRAQSGEVSANRWAERNVDVNTAQLIAQNAELGRALAQIATAKGLIEAKGEVTPAQKQVKAKSGVTGKLSTLSKYYTDLSNMSAITDTQKTSGENIIARAGSTKIGQSFGRAIGTKAQTVRDRINSMRPLLLNDIRQAGEMGAKGMDSEKEMEFFLQAATNPGYTIQTNIAAIIALDDAYGSGELATNKELLKMADINAIDELKREARKTESEEVEGAPGVRRMTEYGISPAPLTTEEPETLPPGVTEEQMQFTMKKYGMTREQVLTRLKGGQ